MVAKAKEGLFYVFREVPMINLKAKESEIIQWKEGVIVKNSFSKLYKKIRQEDNETYMAAIIKYAFKKKKKEATKLQIAFVMTICEVFLDPSHKTLLFGEDIIRPRLEKNLVSF